VKASAAHNEALWERHAEWWQREYSAGADPEYEDQILPLVARHLRAARCALDVGCGEGQVARRLAATGVEVIGLDPTHSQIRIARDRAGGPRYLRARAEALPCPDAAFDAVLLCLALEHVDAFESVIDEVARVLQPDGQFLLLLCHPLLQAPGSGWIDDRVNAEHYWRIESYLHEHTMVDEVAPGVDLQFIHRPLSRYIHAMGRAGLLVHDMEEPPPPAQFIADTYGHTEATTIPRLLVVHARRVMAIS
jgi:SAM-dependent methyltransferase